MPADWCICLCMPAGSPQPREIWTTPSGGRLFLVREHEGTFICRRPQMTGLFHVSSNSIHNLWTFSEGPPPPHNCYARGCVTPADYRFDLNGHHHTSCNAHLPDGAGYTFLQDPVGAGSAPSACPRCGNLSGYTTAILHNEGKVYGVLACPCNRLGRWVTVYTSSFPGDSVFTTEITNLLGLLNAVQFIAIGSIARRVVSRALGLGRDPDTLAGTRLQGYSNELHHSTSAASICFEGTPVEVSLGAAYSLASSPNIVCTVASADPRTVTVRFSASPPLPLNTQVDEYTVNTVVAQGEVVVHTVSTVVSFDREDFLRDWVLTTNPSATPTSNSPNTRPRIGSFWRSVEGGLCEVLSIEGPLVTLREAPGSTTRQVQAEDFEEHFSATHLGFGTLWVDQEGKAYHLGRSDPSTKTIAASEVYPTTARAPVQVAIEQVLLNWKLMSLQPDPTEDSDAPYPTQKWTGPAGLGHVKDVWGDPGGLQLVTFHGPTGRVILDMETFLKTYYSENQPPCAVGEWWTDEEEVFRVLSVDRRGGTVRIAASNGAVNLVFFSNIRRDFRKIEQLTVYDLLLDE